ncbi:MAG: NAD-dependent epimerase/dehydratase family protein [Acidimicrobiales bacterium]
MRILVTGGAGFIGSAVVDRLVADDHDVLVVDCLLPAAHRSMPDHLNAGAEYRIEDLRDADVARRAVEGVDVVCHQASMVGLGVDFDDVASYVDHNDMVTATLLRALHSRGFAGRIVLASSMVVYGEGRHRCPQHGSVRPSARAVADLDAGRYEPRCPECRSFLEPEPVPESAATDPRNVYAATKLHQEHLGAAYAREHGSSTIALRYHNVYGPRMPRDTPYAGVASSFRSAAARGEAPAVFEDGGQRRDFVHVDDVARANLAAISVEPDVSGPFNVCSGEPHTVLDMAIALTSAIPGAPAPEVVGGYRLGDVRHVFASPAQATKVLGFEAEVGFDDGMAAFSQAPLRA